MTDILCTGMSAIQSKVLFSRSIVKRDAVFLKVFIRSAWSWNAREFRPLPQG